MFCSNCGNQIPDGKKFCRFCGAQQGNEPKVNPVQNQQQYAPPYQPAPVYAPAQQEYPQNSYAVNTGPQYQEMPTVRQTAQFSAYQASKKRKMTIIGIVTAVVVALTLIIGGLILIDSTSRKNNVLNKCFTLEDKDNDAVSVTADFNYSKDEETVEHIHCSIDISEDNPVAKEVLDSIRNDVLKLQKDCPNGVYNYNYQDDSAGTFLYFSLNVHEYEEAAEFAAEFFDLTVEDGKIYIEDAEKDMLDNGFVIKKEN